MRYSFAILLIFLFSGLPLKTYPQASNLSKEALQALKLEAKNGKAASQYKLGEVYEKGTGGEKQSIKKAIDSYEKASLQRYDSALYALGRLYQRGIGVSKNEAIALTYYRSASQLGHAEASFKVGEFYEGGMGVSKSEKEAIKYYLAAYEKGHEEATGKLQGLAVEQLADKASSGYLKYQENLNEQSEIKGTGNAEKDYELGKKYETGQGVRRNLGKSFEYYKKSADAGYSKAQLSLGLMYARGVFVPQNNRLAVKYLLAAANQGELGAKAELKKFDLKKYSEGTSSKEFLVYNAENGSAESQYKLYLYHLHGSNGFEQNYNKAMEYCQKAALQDHMAAVMTLGSLYEKGGYKFPPDPKISFLWYRKAAFLRNDSARFMLGEMYANGRGIEKNEALAVRYYLQAANNEFELAMYRLSQYNINKYINENDLEYVKYKATNGDTNEQLKLGKYYYKANDSQAVDWLTKAANNGILEAQKLLADIYLYGKCNIAVNYPACFTWYLKAADKNDLESIRQLAYLYSKNLNGDTDNYLEKAFQRANQYIRLAKKDTSVAIDIKIYRILGDIYFKAQDYASSVINYTDYITGYEEGADQPLHLVETIEQRAKAYFKLGKYESSETDAEIAQIQLENFKNDPSIQPNYKYIDGLLIYLQAKALLNLGHIYKACALFQKAKTSGVVIDQEYDQSCMN